MGEIEAHKGKKYRNERHNAFIGPDKVHKNTVWDILHGVEFNVKVPYRTNTGWGWIPGIFGPQCTASRA